MIQKIVQTVRKARDLTLEELAAALMENIPGESITKQAVSEWERGLSKPRYFLMLMIFMKYQDWRKDFALDILKILKPELYNPTEK